MGRHHKRTGHRLLRAALCTGVVGVGVLQAGLPALAAPAPPPPPPPAGNAPGSATPCAATAKACVDVSEKKAWLTDGHGGLVRGPIPISTGAKGQETPVGTFAVTWKDQYHKSREFDHAPMPYSVFFQPGVAFHGGSLQRQSHGCVHLSDADSKAFFDYLQVYDQVQVVP